NATITGVAFTGNGIFRPTNGSPTVTLSGNFTNSVTGIQMDVGPGYVIVNGPGTFINDVNTVFALDGDTFNSPVDNYGQLRSYSIYQSTFNSGITTHANSTLSVIADNNGAAQLKVVG